ncbi:MAG: 2'-5' RNA ligase family protein [Mycobacteriales bacterium]
MGRRTIGVAIAVPSPYREQLQRERERLGDPNAAAIPPHVTLLPPTTLPAQVLPAVEEHLLAAAGQHQRFPVHLRGSGTFRPVSPVVFVPLAAGISGCERLEALVRSGPLSRSLRFPYHPHVTVAHDLPGALLDRAYAELAGYEARFEADRLTLFEHGTDQIWRPVRDFAFQPGPSGAGDAILG